MITAREIMAAAQAARENAPLFRDMLNAGLRAPELRPMITKGCGKYVEALAKGDIANDAAFEWRGRKCEACPNETLLVAPESVTGRQYNWCGIPLAELDWNERAKDSPKANRPEWAGADWDGVVGPACGCLLSLKRRVASEECPLGYWGPVPAVLTVGGKAVSKGG